MTAAARILCAKFWKDSEIPSVEKGESRYWTLLKLKKKNLQLFTSKREAERMKVIFK